MTGQPWLVCALRLRQGRFADQSAKLVGARFNDALLFGRPGTPTSSGSL